MENLWNMFRLLISTNFQKVGNQISFTLAGKLTENAPQSLSSAATTLTANLPEALSKAAHSLGGKKSKHPNPHKMQKISLTIYSMIKF